MMQSSRWLLVLGVSALAGGGVNNLFAQDNLEALLKPHFSVAGPYSGRFYAGLGNSRVFAPFNPPSNKNAYFCRFTIAFSTARG